MLKRGFCYFLNDDNQLFTHSMPYGLPMALNRAFVYLLRFSPQKTAFAHALKGAFDDVHGFF